MIVFKPLPFIKRIIFMAVPHRGSDMATWYLVKMASGWVTMPHMLVNNVHKIAIKAKLRKNDDPVYVATGLDNLDPGNKMLKALNHLEFADGVPYYCIMGNRYKAGMPGGSDGIVPYSSSHLDGSSSELVVKSGHSVQETGAAVEEVRRLLLLFLKEDNKAEK
jgi:hypothetical protein